MTTTTKQETILNLREEGKNLREISECVGLTRERVRQILKDQGLRTLTAAERIERIAADWRETGMPRHPADVAKAYGMPANKETVKALRRAVPELSLPTGSLRGVEWTLDDVALAVRTVAVHNGIDPKTGWISGKQYNDWRQPSDPSLALVGARFTWGEVMDKAGFDLANAPSQGRTLGDRPRRYTDVDMDRAVLDYIANAETLSVHGMETFLQQHPQHPSMATIRNRALERGIRGFSAIIDDVMSRCVS